MAVSFDLKWRGSRKMKKRLDKLRRKAPGAVIDAAMAEARIIMEISKQRVPVFETEILKSAFIERQGLRITLGYGARHAIYQHEGTRPTGNMPPLERIRPWAEAKLGDARLAFPVARAIALRGLPALKFLEGPIKERLPGMAKRIAARASRSL